jgi:ABC-type sugar transport system, permease component
MVIHKTTGDKIFDFFNHVILTILMLITIYPFLYVVFASLSSADQLAASRGLLYKPLGFSFSAYSAVFDNPMILIGYKNTIIYVLVGTLYNLIMTSLGAFVISRKNFFWKKFILGMVIFTMFFGGGMIPNFLLVKGLGLYNTMWALIIPGAISTMNLIIMKTSFESVPAGLEESAKIDGANDIIILFRIILPLSMPVIAVMILYYGVGHWNAWFGALIYLRNKNLYPLQLVLRVILISNSMNDMLQNVDSDRQFLSETIKHATIIVATLPILLVYPFLQKYFVKGVMIGALKG